MFRIIIADDHEVVRIGLTMLLERLDDVAVSRCADTFESLNAGLGADSYHLLILDLNLGDRSGIEMIRDIHARRPELPILVMSSYPETPYALQAFKAGAAGYLSKGADAATLYQAVKTIRSGRRYLPETLDAVLPCGTDLSEETKDVTELLSRRELEVLTRLGSGAPYKKIAEELGLSPKTVSTYRSRILDKLGLSNTAELLRFSVEHNLGSY